MATGQVWPLSRVEARIAPAAEDPADAIEPALLDELARNREAVGEFKMRHGDREWTQALSMFNQPRAPAHAVSRAYAKFREIVDLCALRAPERVLLLCEAPGGFVQAVADTWRRARWTATTLRGAQQPRFAKRVEMLDNGEVFHPLAACGDVTSADVRDELERALGRFDLVTADGAVDNDAVHETLEDSSAHLFAAQLECAMRCQREGGTAVIKFFGGARTCTQHLLNAACAAYSECCVVKPASSRPVNDERYLVCCGFRRERYVPLLDNAVDGRRFSSGAPIDESIRFAATKMIVEQSRSIHNALHEHRRATASAGGRRGDADRHHRPPWKRPRWRE